MTKGGGDSQIGFVVAILKLGQRDILKLYSFNKNHEWFFLKKMKSFLRMRTTYLSPDEHVLVALRPVPPPAPAAAALNGPAREDAGGSVLGV